MNLKTKIGLACSDHVMLRYHFFDSDMTKYHSIDKI